MVRDESIEICQRQCHDNRASRPGKRSRELLPCQPAWWWALRDGSADACAPPTGLHALPLCMQYQVTRLPPDRRLNQCGRNIAIGSDLNLCSYLGIGRRSGNYSPAASNRPSGSPRHGGPFALTRRHAVESYYAAATAGIPICDRHSHLRPGGPAPCSTLGGLPVARNSSIATATAICGCW